jgi:hypothetical protein
MDTGALGGPPGELVGVVYGTLEPIVASLVRSGVSPIRHSGGDGSRVNWDDWDTYLFGESIQFHTCVGLVLDFVPERHGDCADFPLNQR